ncbi:hypothetical protein BLOT_010265 [Blomia tropicalis]|nr:hypothetical protein BLOT_010265 [Blomia tropicalis]
MSDNRVSSRLTEMINNQNFFNELLNDDKDTEVEIDYGSETEIDEGYEDNSDYEDDDEDDEQEADEEVNKEVNNDLISKDGTVWTLQKLRTNVRQKSANIFTGKKGLTSIAKGITTPYDCFKLFISFIPKIVEYTNIYIKENVITSKKRDAKLTTEEEIEAVIGILYLAGTLKLRYTNMIDIWATDGTGTEIFRSIMSYKRFYFLIRMLRFDDVTKRDKSKKLAPVEEVFEIFNENLMTNYICGPMICVDEKLEKFFGRCKFRMYIPSKPAKYGIKIYSAVDCDNFYTTKLEIYSGKSTDPIYNKSTEVVKRISGFSQERQLW